MAIHIISNRKLDLTPSEFELYNQICRSYDRTNFEGKILFNDIFETNNDGIIMFLRPPSKQFSSMEVMMFMQNIFLQQQLRLMWQQVDLICNGLKQKMIELDEKIKQTNSSGP